MNIHIEKGIRQADIKEIVRWTNTRNPEFLCQYAGDKWSFPLSETLWEMRLVRTE